ncbi:hypothetical protein Kisp01_36030 [Kineosporia sp. NBRC 101677]|nr:hypothetical protein Kisp01_36030 [Kineosporia sp. NBRC 101677]
MEADPPVVWTCPASRVSSRESSDSTPLGVSVPANCAATTAGSVWLVSICLWTMCAPRAVSAAVTSWTSCDWPASLAGVTSSQVPITLFRLWPGTGTQVIR